MHFHRHMYVFSKLQIIQMKSGWKHSLCASRCPHRDYTSPGILLLLQFILILPLHPALLQRSDSCSSAGWSMYGSPGTISRINSIYRVIPLYWFFNRGQDLCNIKIYFCILYHSWEIQVYSFIYMQWLFMTSKSERMEKIINQAKAARYVLCSPSLWFRLIWHGAWAGTAFHFSVMSRW